MIVLCVFIITTYIKTIDGDPNTQTAHDFTSPIVSLSSSQKIIHGPNNANKPDCKNIDGYKLQDNIDLAEDNFNKYDNNKQSNIMLISTDVIKGNSDAYTPDYKEYAIGDSSPVADRISQSTSSISLKPLYDNFFNDSITVLDSGYDKIEIGEELDVGKIIDKRDCQLLSSLKYSQMNPTDILANRALTNNYDIPKCQANVRSKNEISSFKIPLLPLDTSDNQFPNALNDENFLEMEIQKPNFCDARNSKTSSKLRNRQEFNNQICQEKKVKIPKRFSSNNCRSNMLVDSTENCVINIPIEITIYDSSCEIFDETNFTKTSNTEENSIDSYTDSSESIESNEYEYQDTDINNPSDELWKSIPDNDFFNYLQTYLQNNNSITPFLAENILSALLSNGVKPIGIDNDICNDPKPIDEVVFRNTYDYLPLPKTECIPQSIIPPTYSPSIPNVICNENDNVSEVTLNISNEIEVRAGDTLVTKSKTKPCISTITINLLPNDDVINNHVIVIV